MKKEILFNYVGNYPKNRENGWSEKIQGVTHDDEYWYFTQNKYLWKFPVTYDLNSKITKSRPEIGVLRECIPKELDDMGYDHFGDFSYFDGYLFIPMTGKAEPCIAIFEASSLRYVTMLKMPSFSSLGWCAVNCMNSRLYISDKILSLDYSESNSSPLISYFIDIGFLKTNKKLSLNDKREHVLNDKKGDSVRLKHMQGGAFDNNGNLYLMNGFNRHLNRKNTGIHVFDIEKNILITNSSQSGSFKYQYQPGGITQEEPEGLTYWDLDNKKAPNIKGVLHAIMLDNDSDEDDFYFKHYEIKFSNDYFIGDIIHNRVHRPDCDRIQYVREKFQLKFWSLQDAMNQEYSGCSSCLSLYKKEFNFIGNRRTKELHKLDCRWVKKMAEHNKRKFITIGKSLKDGYNGCSYCLSEYDTDFAKYIGNKKSKELHTKNCKFVKQISQQQKIGYASILLAIKDGYDGCSYCLPEYDME